MMNPRQRTNDKIMEILRSHVTDIGDGRGINLMDISTVCKEIIEVTDAAVHLMYAVGNQDGVRSITDSFIRREAQSSVNMDRTGDGQTFSLDSND